MAATLSLALLALRERIDVANVALLLLLPVLAGATFGGLGPGVLAAVVCTLSFDLLFIRPYGTLSVGNGQDLLTLLLYLAVGALVAELSARVRAQAEAAARRAAINALLYDLSSVFLAPDLDGVLGALVRRLGDAFGLRACAVLLPDSGGQLQTRAHWGPTLDDRVADRRQIAVSAQWAFARGETVALRLHGAPAPDGEDDAPARGEHLLFLPLRGQATAGSARSPGLLALRRPPGIPLTDEETRLLASFATQAGLAVERARLAGESAAAAVVRESDRAKSVLLSNVSHDLRTPITTIGGAAESLLQADLHLDEDTRQELLASIRDEADRLAALVANLLDLSRLEAGALQMERHLYSLEEIVGGVLQRMRVRLAQHGIATRLETEMPLVLVDYALIERVLVNVLDNAAAYSPSGTRIEVTLAYKDGEAVLTVADQGPGVPPDARTRVFARFHRLGNDRTPGKHGTGLGLAICHSIVLAHGGRIWIDEAPGGGAAVRIALPAPPPNSTQEEDAE